MGADTSGRLPVEHKAIHALLAIKYASLGVAVSADGAVMILKTLEIRHSKYDHIEPFFNHAKCVLTSGVSADTFLAVKISIVTRTAVTSRLPRPAIF